MMASEWNQIIGTVKAIGVWDILDIVIVAGLCRGRALHLAFKGSNDQRLHLRLQILRKPQVKRYKRIAQRN